MTGEGAVVDSDDHLVELVRSGDSRAYGELWKRHAGPAFSVARTFVSLDAEDIVSEAFARVLRAIRAGGGPTSGFRPYLIMAVRNVGRRWYNRDTSVNISELEYVVDPDAKEGELEAVAEFEGGAALAAFKELPKRWQEVLWYSEVDELKPREISVLLGLAPNAVSALIVRAKRGLRDAWISAQLTSASTPDCRAALKDMGAYTRGALSARATASLDRHLATCATCPSALTEAKNLATLALTVVPAVAGTAGAAGYVAATQAPPMSAALASAEGAIAPSATTPDVKDEDRKRRPWLVFLIWALVAVMIAGAVYLGVRTFTGAGVDGEIGESAGPAEVASDDPPSPSPSATPSPTASQTPSPSPSSFGSPSAIPSPPQRGTNPPAPVVPIAPAPPAPTAGLTQFDGRMYPWVAGVDAVPGARVEVMSGGTVIASATARSDGSWKAHLVGESPGGYSVAARQTANGVQSPTGASLSYTVSQAPTPTDPASGATVVAARFHFGLADVPGTVLQREIVGATPVQTIRVPSSGVWNEYLAVNPGTYEMRLRYANPATGDYGPWMSRSFTAE
ncbi:sigma-70 family RNA polymerase sigma factor [Microbacterium sp. LWH10-1.2]|uniref:sigma-70 family RNA polymerase sigma factor n=1 Tax=unclassified Microbacterium TaxID=2609290 RepID=UPI003138BDF0